MDATGEHFGFDDKVDVPESNVLLPKGEAFYTITALEKERKDFGKFGMCNIAVLQCMCTPIVEGNNQRTEVKVQLPLVKEMGWKILQVATSSGLRKKGDGNDIDPRWWSQFKGRDGRCLIGHRTGKVKKEGQSPREFNEIEEFLAPEEAGLDLK